MSNTKWEISQLWHNKNKQVLGETMMILPLWKTITLTNDYSSVCELNYNPRVGINKSVIDDTIVKFSLK
jgi:hypothetical protein